MELLPTVERVILYARKTGGNIQAEKSAIHIYDHGLAREIFAVLQDGLEGDKTFLTRYSQHCGRQIGQLKCSLPRDDIVSSLKKHLASWENLPRTPTQSTPRDPSACWICEASGVEGPSRKPWR